MNEKFMDVMLTFASKVSNNRWLSCIRNAFTDMMPVIIIGSFCTLFSNVVCNTTPGYMSVANIPGFAWLGALKPLFVAANYGTMNMMAVGIVILLSASVAESYGNKDKALTFLFAQLQSLLQPLNPVKKLQLQMSSLLIIQVQRGYSLRCLLQSLLQLFMSSWSTLAS